MGFFEIAEHGILMFLIYLDFCFNKIVFIRSHALIILVVAILYAITNLIVTLSYKPVYKGITWKNGFTYYIIIGAIIFILAIYFLGRYLIKKLKKMNDSTVADSKENSIHEKNI